MKTKQHDRPTPALTIAQRSTRAWNHGAMNAYKKGSVFYSAWLRKWRWLFFTPEWDENFLKKVEKRYGLNK